MKRVVALAAALALAGVFAAAQEQPEEAKEKKAGDPTSEALRLIDQGRTALVEGHPDRCVQRLQQAISVVQRLAEKGLVRFLPELGEGWKAEKPESQSGSWGSGDGQFQWTQVTRRYVQEGEGGATVEVMISTSPQFIESQRAMVEMYKDPAMRAMLNRDPDRSVDVIDEGGWSGLMTSEKGGESAAMAIHEGLMVNIQVSRGDAALLKRVWSAVDRAKLAALAPKR